MAVDTKHPDYTDWLEEWELMRAAFRGPIAMFREGEKYLPMPSGFAAQADGGASWYEAYKKRARFPDIIAPTLRGMVGLIHRKEAAVEMPEPMMQLWEKATKQGLPLEAFHRRITAELLLTGRYGILTDAAQEGSDIPYLAGYSAESIINWSDEMDFVVLDESGPVRNGFTWKDEKKFRSLELVDGKYVQKVWDKEPGTEQPNKETTGTGAPPQGQPVGDKPENNNGSGAREVTPQKRGNGALEKIPFVFVSPSDLSAKPKEIPLIGVARAAIAIYQLDADYRHQLYMSGQETFVTTGLDNPVKVTGSGINLNLPVGGDAKYVGPSGVGIAGHKQAIDDAKEDAVAAGAQLFDVQSGQESGEALRLRYAAQTATLRTISLTSGQALEAALRNVALFMNLDPTKVTVKMDLKFVEQGLTPQEANELVKLWMGAAISKETLFDNLQQGGIISEETTFEEEERKIAQDEIDRPVLSDPNADPEEEEDEDPDDDDAAIGTEE